MSDAEVIRQLAAALKPWAEWELPVGVEQTVGVEWLAKWRKRAQAALAASGYLEPSLARDLPGKEAL